MRVSLEKKVVHVDEVSHPDGTLLELGSEVQCAHADVLQVRGARAKGGGYGSSDSEGRRRAKSIADPNAKLLHGRDEPEAVEENLSGCHCDLFPRVG